MGTPKHLSAYGREEEILLRALESERGVAVEFASKGLATHFRQRVNAFRVLLRKQSTTIYQPEDEAYNKSQFDHLLLSLPMQVGTTETWQINITRGKPVRVIEL